MTALREACPADWVVIYAPLVSTDEAALAVISSTFGMREELKVAVENLEAVQLLRWSEPRAHGL